MADLKTTYLGLELDNPIIVGSCGITKSAEGVKRCADAGAGAVVLKSLFEEEIRLYFRETNAAVEKDAAMHPEAYEYLRADLASLYGAQNYVALVRDAAAAVDIPVIASVNCTSSDVWVKFARQIEAAGAAALELNIYVLPTDSAAHSGQVEQAYFDALEAVLAEVNIPVAVKLVPFITNLTAFTAVAQKIGAAGLVLFNRFFHPDINLASVSLEGGLSFSSPQDYRLALRWIALLSGGTDCDLCASGGIHDGESALKLLLAGASAVQMTSSLYLNRLDRIAKSLDTISKWMAEHDYSSISDFRGLLSRDGSDDTQLLERAQYIKAFVGVE